MIFKLRSPQKYLKRARTKMSATDHLRLSRRRALILLGGLGLVGLSGCCCLRPFPSPEIGPDPNGSDITNPFLRPVVWSNLTKPFKYCIETHAHFFNASDVDVNGFLDGSRTAYNST